MREIKTRFRNTRGRMIAEASRGNGRMLILALASGMEVASMAAFGLTISHHDVIGVTGAVAVLVAVVAAIMAGPLMGLLVAIVGGVAFFAFISDWGSTAPLIATLAATAVWGLAAYASGAVANRWRHQEVARRCAEAEAAELHARLEMNLLPDVPRSLSGLEVLTRYVPSERRLGIGGDFFDAAPLSEGGLAIVIGDVVGHGADAAALGAQLRTSWRALVCDASPARLVSTLEEVLARERANEDAFATLCLAWIHGSSRCADLLLLGHVPPLLIANGRVAPLSIKPTPPLGVADEMTVSTLRIRLPESWSLFFYTDGLIEGRAAPGARERYGLERLLAAISCEAWSRLGEPSLDRILAEVVGANGEPLPDDVAVMQVSWPADSASQGLPLGAGGRMASWPADESALVRPWPRDEPRECVIDEVSCTGTDQGLVNDPRAERPAAGTLLGS